jgi:subtilisin family serine protease
MSDRYKMIPDFRVTRRVQILAERLDYNHKLMNVPHMWQETRGDGVKVAVLDTGLPQHMDLAPIKPHKSCIDGYLVDKNGHATHVAGIIAALANNNMGVAGIAPDVEDHYCAVLDADGSGGIAGLVRGIRWAVDELGADIINMSLGIPAYAGVIPELEGACDYAVSQGVTVIAAAGNESGGVGQPAQYDSVIAVAAVNSRKQHARFSNTGPEVDFAAGGVDVYSTYLGDSYASLSGTSMASPAFTAVAALILAKHRKEGEELSPAELKDHLKKIAYDVGPEGFDETFGHGIPIFGRTEDPIPEEPEEPNDPPQDDDSSKPGPKANCAYWRMWRGFIQSVDAQLAQNPVDLGAALASGVNRLANQTEVIDQALKRKES